MVRFWIVRFLIGFALSECSMILAMKDHHPRCAELVSINVPHEDPERAVENYGVRADHKRATLNRKPNKFRLVDKGLTGDKGVVSLESLDKPNHYLRHKNYRFRLEKFRNTSVYEKDATFYLLQVKDNPPLYAFELVGHPTWFLKHAKKRPYKVLLEKVDENTKNVMDATFFLSRIPCPENEIVSTAVKKTFEPKPFAKENADSEVNIETEDDLLDGTASKKPKNSETSKTGSNDNRYLKMLEKDIEEKVKVLTKELNGSDKIQSERPSKVETDNKKSTSKAIVTHNADNYISHKKNDEDTVVVGTEPEKMQPVSVKNIGVKKEEKTNNLATIDEKVTNNENGDDFEEKMKADGFEYDETNKDNKSKSDNNIVIQTEEQSDPAQLDPIFQLNDSNEHANDDLGTKPHDAHLSAVQAQHSNHAIVDNALPKKPFSTNPIQGTRNNSYAKFASAKKVIEQEKLKLKQILHSIDFDSVKQVNIAPKFNEFKKQPSSFTSIERIMKGQIKHHGNIGQSVAMPFVHAANFSINNSAAEDNFIQPDQQQSSQVYYTGKCEDVFPDACKEWAKKNYCLTFGALMKRYCRSACSLCDNVLTTGFTHCDKSCGGGRRFRMIKVNNREVLQRQACNTHNCPINGGYSSFSNFSECSVTCGKGLRYRHRACDKPKPKFGGKDCSKLGSPVQTQVCHVKPCRSHNDLYDDDTTDLGSNADQPFDDESNDEGASLTLGSGEDDRKHDEQQLDYGNPEYRMENFNNFNFNVPPKAGYYFRKYFKTRHPIILNHLGNDLYEHQDPKGKKRIYNIRKHESGANQRHHLHAVMYNGEEVARLKCRPSQLMRFNMHAINSPISDLQQDDNPLNFFKRPQQRMRVIDEGKVAYDKYGLPFETTKAVVASDDGPYSIVLSHGKDNDIKVSEHCIENDISVNPENYAEQGNVNQLDASLSRGQNNHLYQPVSSPLGYLPLEPVKKFNSVKTNNGMYEYKYTTDPSYQVETQPDLKRTLSKAMNEETHQILDKTLKENDLKSSLSKEIEAQMKEDEENEKRGNSTKEELFTV